MSVVNTYNLFVDSSRGRDMGCCTGDDYTVNLQEASVIAGAGQYLRLTLNNFAMNKVFPQVNQYNNVFKFKYFSFGSEDPAFSTTLRLPIGNYESQEDLVQEFATMIKDHLETIAPTRPVTATSEIRNGKMFCTFKVGTNGMHSEGRIMEIEPADETLLGGKFQVPFISSSVTDSLGHHYTAVESHYPLLNSSQSTMKNVYLRVPTTAQTGLETGSLSALNSTRPTHAQLGDILAEIPVNDVEFGSTIYYNAPSERIFFANLKQKSVEQLRLRLTDHHNRPLPKYDADQAITGNLSFTCNIRIEVIQERHIDELQSQKIPPSIPARFSSLLTHQKNGENTFGKSPGF